MTGVVASVTVAFGGLTHGALNDVDAMVVSPTGANLVVLSDLERPEQPETRQQHQPDLLGFGGLGCSRDRQCAQRRVSSHEQQPGSRGRQFFRPRRPPRPARPPWRGLFPCGINPNGEWRLFIVDDTSGDVGSMAGGWSLTITTEVTAVATTTTVTSSDATSTTGDPVTFTASVRASATPVTHAAPCSSAATAPTWVPRWR